MITTENYREIYNDLVEETNEFTSDSGVIKCSSKKASDIIREILSGYYGVIDYGISDIEDVDGNVYMIIYNDLLDTDIMESLKKLLDEKIVKKGSKWQVQSEKGRNMGTYDNKADAEERLRQVEYFKHKNESLGEDKENTVKNTHLLEWGYDPEWGEDEWPGRGELEIWPKEGYNWFELKDKVFKFIEEYCFGENIEIFNGHESEDFADVTWRATDTFDEDEAEKDLVKVFGDIFDEADFSFTPDEEPDPYDYNGKPWEEQMESLDDDFKLHHSLKEDIPTFWEWVDDQGLDPDVIEDNPDLEEYFRQQYDITYNFKTPEDYDLLDTDVPDDYDDFDFYHEEKPEPLDYHFVCYYEDDDSPGDQTGDAETLDDAIKMCKGYIDKYNYDCAEIFGPKGDTVATFWEGKWNTDYGESLDETLSGLKSKKKLDILRELKKDPNYKEDPRWKEFEDELINFYHVDPSEADIDTALYYTEFDWIDANLAMESLDEDKLKFSPNYDPVGTPLGKGTGLGEDYYDEENEVMIYSCPNCGTDLEWLGTQGKYEEYKCPECGEYFYDEGGKLINSAEIEESLNEGARSGIHQVSLKLNLLRELKKNPNYKEDPRWEKFADVYNDIDEAIEDTEDYLLDLQQDRRWESLNKDTNHESLTESVIQRDMDTLKTSDLSKAPVGSIIKIKSGDVSVDTYLKVDGDNWAVLDDKGRRDSNYKLSNSQDIYWELMDFDEMTEFEIDTAPGNLEDEELQRVVENFFNEHVSKKFNGFCDRLYKASRKLDNLNFDNFGDLQDNEQFGDYRCEVGLLLDDVTNPSVEFYIDFSEFSNGGDDYFSIIFNPDGTIDPKSDYQVHGKEMINFFKNHSSQFTKLVDNLFKEAYSRFIQTLKKAGINLGESLDEAKNDTLNPAIWENEELKPEVKEKLQLIADKFIEKLKEDEIPLDVDDIVIVGSNRNYNYGPQSDIDLHIIADLSQFKGREKELAEKIYQCKKSIFNDKYDPMINGFEVEIYVEPAGDKNKNDIPDEVE